MHTDVKTPGFSLEMSSSPKFRVETDSQEHHRGFALNYGSWICLDLMGKCSETESVFAELSIEVKTVV